MNRSLIRLAQRRERLAAQAEAQRRALVQDVEPWRKPLALADQGLSALRYLKTHPEWIIGSVVLLSALRPRRVGRWLGRGLVSWQLVQKLRGR